MDKTLFYKKYIEKLFGNNIDAYFKREVCLFLYEIRELLKEIKNDK